MNFRWRATHGLCLGTLFAIPLGRAPAQSTWSRFRGPDGSGVAPDAASLPAVLDPERNLLWKRALPPGHSSPCIAGGRVFVTGHDEGTLATLCVDAASGEILWRRDVEAKAAERLHPIHDPATPTPTTDGERVFVYFGSFGLLAYDFEGEEVWRRELPVPKNTFGTAASPVIAGEVLVFLHDANDESFVEAIRPATGATVWKTPRPGFQSGWSTPAVRSVDGTLELLVYGVWWLTAYDLADGSERWSVPGLSDEPIVTPTSGGDLVFITSYNMKTNSEVIGLPTFDSLLEQYDEDGDGQLDSAEAARNDSVLSRSDADGEGDHPLRIFFRFLDVDKDGELTAAEWPKLVDWLNGFEHANAILALRPGAEGGDPEIVWQYPHGVPECPSSLVYGGRVYLVKNGGLATCLDAETGAVHYQERLDSRGPCYASPVAGDGKVFTASAHGVVTIFEAGDSLKVLSRNDLGERIMATPALVNGKVYVRTEAALYAFGNAE